MKNNSSGNNTKQPVENSPSDAINNSQTNLKSYIDGLKKVTGQKTKQRNPNGKGQYPKVIAAGPRVDVPGYG